MAEKKTKPKVKNSAAKPKAAPAPAATILPDEEIALKAYALWEKRGRPFGSAEEDWFKAKEQLGA